MKKILLGTTAFLAASVAFAQQAPTATVSGSFNTHINAASVTTANGNAGSTPTIQGIDEAGWNVVQPAAANEVHVTARGKTDAGLAYMGQVQMRFMNVTTDEAFMELSGDWGRFQLGQNDSPAGDNHIGGQSAQSGTGGIDGNHGLNPAGANRLVGVGYNISGDDAKVVYYAPTFYGLTLGASLAPSGGTVGNAGLTGATAFAAPSVAYRNAVEASARYSVDLAGAKIQLGATYAQAKNNTEFASNTVVAGATGNTVDANARQVSKSEIHNHVGYNVGVKVDVGAFSIGAGVADHGKGGTLKNVGAKLRDANGNLAIRNVAGAIVVDPAGVGHNAVQPGAITDNGNSSSIGIKYKLDDTTEVGIGYLASRQSIVSNANWNNTRSSTMWSLGASTAVAPGLSVFGEFNSISGTTGRVTNGNYRGSEILVGTSISF